MTTERTGSSPTKRCRTISSKTLDCATFALQGFLEIATVWCGKPPNDSLGSFRADVKILRNNTQEARVVYVAVPKHESPQAWCSPHSRERIRHQALQPSHVDAHRAYP